MSYELIVEKQGRTKRQGGWKTGNYHWYYYGRQGWRIRPAMVLLRGDGGDIRVPATCETVADALDWLQPRNTIARQGHWYFRPIRESEQDLIVCRGPAGVNNEEEHLAECSSIDHRGRKVYSGYVMHGTHERIYLPRWCIAIPPTSFATQTRKGD